MIYISIGSNVGNRQHYIEAALYELSKLAELVAYSSVYETAPWGNTNQASFLNVSAAIDTTMQPLELLRAVKSIEKKLGREQREHWGPREIDIDIIFWHDNATFTSDELTIPHREFANRAFVIIPTLEVAQKIQDSNTEKLLAALATTLSADDVKKLDNSLEIKSGL